jgi:hypothetical protein
VGIMEERAQLNGGRSYGNPGWIHGQRWRLCCAGVVKHGSGLVGARVGLELMAAAWNWALSCCHGLGVGICSFGFLK